MLEEVDAKLRALSNGQTGKAGGKTVSKNLM